MTTFRVHSFHDANAVRNAQSAPATLSEKAYYEVSRMIQGRDLPSGQPIVESHLAERLGVSRTPLRQALQRLESEGLLRKLESRSYVVRRVELKEYLHSLKVRELLEPEAAELSLGRIEPEAIARARANLHEVRDRVPYDILAHWQSDDEVHDLYISACSNLTIRDILQSLRVTTKLFEIEQLSERLKPDSSQHEAILDGLAARDATAVRAAIILHLRSLAAFAIEVL